MFLKIKTIIGQLAQKYLRGSKITFTYPSLSQINIQDWFEVLETGNVKIINTTEQHFNKLYDDFFEQIDNKESKSFLNTNFSRYKLSSKINLLIKCYENLNYIYSNALNIENALNLEKTILSTINILHPRAKLNGSIEQKLQTIEQLITINNNQLSKLTVKKLKEEKSNYMAQIVKVELALKLTINPRETSVQKFIEYYKIAQKNGKSTE